MELIIKAVIVHSLEDVEVFSIKVTEPRYLIVKKRLKLEYKKAVDILKQMKEGGLIHSTSIPKNKQFQKQLNKLVKAKKIIKKSLRSLNEVYT